MNKERIIKASISIFQGFDGLTDDGPFEPVREAFKIEDEINRLSGFDEMKPGMDGNTFNKWMSIMHKHGALTFAVGYVLGQIVDLTGEEILHDIDTIKEVLKERSLLPYLPKERKGGEHGKGSEKSNRSY
jgi:hypothetical protein